jgi:transcriptional regulator with XRE-family HTH domain
MGTERAAREFDRELGARLRGIREGRRLSLQNVAAMSGGTLKVAALRSWETAERRIPVSRLPDVARVYGLPMTALLPGEGDDGPLPGMDEFPAEMSLSRDRWGRYVLVIDGPSLHGTAVTSSPEIALAIAGAYAAFRRDQQAVSAA